MSRTVKLEDTTASRELKLESRYNKTIFPHGLRVVSEEIPHVRSISVGIWIDVGSRDEEEWSNGISHFIEHMLFKGTERRSVREIARSVESVGGYLNAFTSKEHTCYYARVLDEYTDLALDVLSDIVLHPVFPDRELEKERGVIIEELKNAEDDPDDLIHDYFDRRLFGSHPLGFPVIGTERNLKTLKRSDLINYRQRHYLPSRMVVAACGHLKHESIIELVEKYFAPRLSAPPPSPLKRSRPRLQKPLRVEYERPIQQSHVCLGTVAFSIRSKYRYPLLILNTLLGDGMSSRLFQNIREKYGFAYNVYSYANLLSDTGLFGAYIGTDQRHIERSIELIWNELKRIREKPVPQAELNRTKAQLKGSMMLSLESIPSRMMRLGNSELYFNEVTSLDSIINQIDKVTQDDIQTVAKELFVEEALSTVIFRPQAKRIDELSPVSRKKAAHVATA